MPAWTPTQERESRLKGRRLEATQILADGCQRISDQRLGAHLAPSILHVARFVSQEEEGSSSNRENGREQRRSGFSVAASAYYAIFERDGACWCVFSPRK